MQRYLAQGEHQVQIVVRLPQVKEVQEATRERGLEQSFAREFRGNIALLHPDFRVLASRL